MGKQGKTVDYRMAFFGAVGLNVIIACASTCRQRGTR